MAQLRLATYPQGTAWNQPRYRIFIHLHFVTPDQKWSKPRGELDKSREAFATVDTGASLTNLPLHVWQPFESELRLETGQQPEATIAIGGQRIPYRLAWVFLAASDSYGNWMPPAWTLARCHLNEDYENLVPTVLGLTSPFLMEGRCIQQRGTLKSTDGREIPQWWLKDPPWWHKYLYW